MNSKSDTHILMLCCALALLPQHSLAAADENPGIDMLEFLAEAEQDQNEWIDPLTVQDYTETEIAQAKPEEKRHD
jgi:hypothetical protein